MRNPKLELPMRVFILPSDAGPRRLKLRRRRALADSLLGRGKSISKPIDHRLIEPVQ